MLQIQEVRKDSVVLMPPSDFSFQETLRYLTRSGNECLYRVSDCRVFRCILVDDVPVLFELTSSETSVLIRFPNGNPDDSAKLAVARYVWEWFDLDTDMQPFYRMAKSNRLLKPLCEAYFGLRVIGIPDLFEALCWAIIGQQINLTFAYTLKRRFVETYGHAFEWHGEEHWLFPNPETVAKLSVEDLQRLQFTGKKAEYIIEVARRMVAGSLTKEGLQLLTFEDAQRELLHVRGIGPWTANYVLMRCLHDPSAFPIGDVGLHNAMKARLGLDRKPTLTEIADIASGWKGWEAYATFYLWRSLVDE